MTEKNIKETLQSKAVKTVLSYLDKDPDRNMPKLLEWTDRFDRDGLYEKQRALFHEVLKDPQCNWYRLAKSLWTDIDAGVKKVFFENFIVNSALLGTARQNRFKQENGCNVPWAILMDPTSACNLHCTGCWAAEYGNRLNMSLETLDGIIRRARKWAHTCICIPAESRWCARRTSSACVRRIRTVSSWRLPTAPSSTRNLRMRCCGRRTSCQPSAWRALRKRPISTVATICPSLLPDGLSALLFALAIVIDLALCAGCIALCLSAPLHRLICRIVQQLFRRSRWQARADWFVEETAELPYLFAPSFGKVHAMSALLIYRFFTFALLLSCSHVQRCAEKIWRRAHRLEQGEKRS